MILMYFGAYDLTEASIFDRLHLFSSGSLAAVVKFTKVKLHHLTNLLGGRHVLHLRSADEMGHNVCLVIGVRNLRCQNVS